MGALLLTLLPALLVVAGDEGVETGEALTALVWVSRASSAMSLYGMGSYALMSLLAA